MLFMLESKLALEVESRVILACNFHGAALYTMCCYTWHINTSQTCLAASFQACGKLGLFLCPLPPATQEEINVSSIANQGDVTHRSES